MVSLLRYQVFLGYAVVLLASWYASLQAKDAFVAKFALARLVIDWAPLWLILALAVYAISCIGYGMITSRDYPEAVEELEQQIQEAKAEMKRRGIIIE